MTLNWWVLGIVLLAALLHASWNTLVKSSQDKDLDVALIHLVGSGLALPMVLLVGLPSIQAWPYITASILIHIGYYVALSGAYRHGELGLTYPLMRGVAPLLVALSSKFVLGEVLSPLAWGGVLGISGGVVLLGLNRSALAAPKAIGFALGNAIIIAMYTAVDGLGVRASGNALQYVAILFALDGWPFALLMLATRGGALQKYARHRWPVAALGASASLGSYGMVLWAMTLAPVATIAALRETSVLIAVLLGTWFLKESFTLQRTVGACVMVAGVMALRMGTY
ncbi:DMT family transporter [Rhodoferax sp.]|uniref:DMT family transporter n=1 Tax=Rhodoferax sp. TaxID=50421 RepID=UPI00284CAEA2|nr:DMT family transporter [Rhodoferax sp.]MDR3369875.1 DMT family transporter [Rhodoferax sp.]